MLKVEHSCRCSISVVLSIKRKKSGVLYWVCRFFYATPQEESNDDNFGLFFFFICSAMARRASTRNGMIAYEMKSKSRYVPKSALFDFSRNPKEPTTEGRPCPWI